MNHGEILVLVADLTIKRPDVYSVSSSDGTFTVYIHPSGNIHDCDEIKFIGLPKGVSFDTSTDRYSVVITAILYGEGKMVYVSPAS